jgi:hypothetical protein
MTGLKAGDWVEVKLPGEIAHTLDQDGTLHGLPFMPEMAQYCGRRSQIQRIAEKTCVELSGGDYKIREFLHNDVVILKELRCSGQSHDECGRACVLFWKADWLRKIDVQKPASDMDSFSGDVPDKIKTMRAPGQYFCQATELVRATQPLSRAGILKKSVVEIRSGNRGVLEMMALTMRPLWRKATRWLPRRRLAGNLKRTPTDMLELQPGELVRIKSAKEIVKTLDPAGRNRGLLCDYGMCQYSGGTYRVRNRLERMISEPTGEMLQVTNTVILDGLSCLCWNVFGGCPRKDFMYWREIWLKRIEPRDDTRNTQRDSAISHDDAKRRASPPVITTLEGSPAPDNREV